MPITKKSLENLNKRKKFVKGVVTNPKGRPRKLPKLDELLTEVLGSIDGESEKSKAKEIIEALYKQARKGNVGAASLLLDRAYGRVTQSLKLSGSINSENKHVIEFVDNSKPKK